MIIGVPKENYPGERRVALVPLVLPTLIKAGFQVLVETGAGEQAGYPDSQYVEKGARIVPDRADIFREADIVVQILCYGSNDVTGRADLPLMRRGQLLMGFLRPLGSAEVLQEIAGGEAAVQRGRARVVTSAVVGKAEHWAGQWLCHFREGRVCAVAGIEARL